MPKVSHYRNKCIGCGVCQEMHPQRWRMSKRDGKATLLKAIVRNHVHVLEIPVAEADLTREVAKACPVNIIKI